MTTNLLLSCCLTELALLHQVTPVAVTDEVPATLVPLEDLIPVRNTTI